MSNYKSQELIKLIKDGDRQSYINLLNSYQNRSQEEKYKLVNERDTEGNTPVLLLMLNGDTETAYWLVEKFGALTGIPNKRGQSVKIRDIPQKDDLAVQKPLDQTIDNGNENETETETGTLQLLDDRNIFEKVNDTIGDAFNAVLGSVGLTGGMSKKDYRAKVKELRDKLEDKIIKTMKLKVDKDLPKIKAIRILYSKAIRDELNKGLKKDDKPANKVTVYETSISKFSEKDLKKLVKDKDLKERTKDIEKKIKEAEDKVEKFKQQIKKEQERIENFGDETITGGESDTEIPEDSESLETKELMMNDHNGYIQELDLEEEF